MLRSTKDIPDDCAFRLDGVAAALLSRSSCFRTSSCTDLSQGVNLNILKLLGTQSPENAADNLRKTNIEGNHWKLRLWNSTLKNKNRISEWTE